MILNTQQMLDAASRCEEWDDTRTTTFMNTPPYTTIGEKSIQNFIDSIGICDITYKDIFWVINNNYLTKENRLDFCLNRFNLYANLLNIDFTGINTDLEYIINNPLDNSTQIETLITLCENELCSFIDTENDITCNYRFYKLIKLFLIEIQNDSNIINIIQKICNILIDFYPEIFTYENTLNDIVSLYE